MAMLRAVSLAVLAVVIVLLSHTGMTSARSTALQRGPLTRLLSKRNSWWSKKSVDASSDFAPGIIPEASLEAQDLENSSDGNSELFLCYMSSCVPSFTACATRSRTTNSFNACQMKHRHCAVRCLQMVEVDSSTMK
ncbi:hypothetical protein ACOMHN_003053 [Nucella lapillus]